MVYDRFQMQVVTAAEAGDHVAELEAESALALRAGAAAIDTYMRAQDDELDAWRHHYVGAAVTEIATLRAELAGLKTG